MAQNTGAQAWRGWWITLIGFAIVWLICLGIWAATGQGYFWPIWPALGMVIGLIYAAWRIAKVSKRA